ncbi:uncharacterized protein MYCFIDRAFT_174252 [Pseudocercospora fijiensis CIRAD86]|uniref:Uncharacterized protein n=1 Tax=Pseudocercospora fijiensis (strain CIRAD86) TaxID=383855 RepID=M3AZU3_PSEFD|nr:uncharacterized protein MYCFIDRAFT_174252 [Pseudocercospora fijiensis CIRAD86]EME82697.1 hypothetical protein MYCFIDRAFT_174252 [Pseudocercospora fijiensis CIRAD86]
MFAEGFLQHAISPYGIKEAENVAWRATACVKYCSMHDDQRWCGSRRSWSR